jgi:FkbM family methyltransferase
MKRFSGFENSVRKNFFIYIFLRRLAPFICRFIDLEEGFSFSKQIQPKSTKYCILDVGSNDGTSIRMFRRYFPFVKIIAIDPVTTPRFKLKNVTLIKSALSEKAGSRTLVTPIVNGKQLTQYSSFYKEKMITQICSDMDLVETEVSTIVNEVNFNTIDNLSIDPFFIKIDVEGAELEVLKGSLNVINKCNPVILVEIQNGNAYGAIKELLSAYGYINISPEKKSRKLILKDSITPILNFEGGTNNYVWINPSKPVSWHFI